MDSKRRRKCVGNRSSVDRQWLIHDDYIASRRPAYFLGDFLEHAKLLSVGHFEFRLAHCGQSDAHSFGVADGECDHGWANAGFINTQWGYSFSGRIVLLDRPSDCARSGDHRRERDLHAD